MEEEILPVARELGIGFVAYSPLGRGFLTGKIRSVDDLQEGDSRRQRFPRFERENLEANLELVEQVEAVASRHDATPGQVALAWVLSRGDEVVAIPGTKRVERLEENLGALELELTDEDLAELDGLASDSWRARATRPSRWERWGDEHRDEGPQHRPRPERAPGAHRGRRRAGRGVRPRARAARDGPPLALVPADRGRPRGRPRAVGQDLALPVQGRRELLLRARRRRAPSRPRLDLPRPDPGGARDRRDSSASTTRRWS